MRRRLQTTAAAVVAALALAGCARERASIDPDDPRFAPPPCQARAAQALKPPRADAHPFIARFMKRQDLERYVECLESLRQDV